MTDSAEQDTLPTPDLQCIYRTGCPKPEVCRKVGHCTSMTATDFSYGADLGTEQAEEVGIAGSSSPTRHNDPALVKAVNSDGPASLPSSNEVTDWMWCYENPREAAATIDQLRTEKERLHNELLRLKHFKNPDGTYINKDCAHETKPSHAALLARVPRVKPEFVAEIQELPREELERRVITQKDWLEAHAQALDGLGLKVGVEGCRLPRDIRRAFEQRSTQETPVHEAHATDDEVRACRICTPHRKWPGEPPHCPTCDCGSPERTTALDTTGQPVQKATTDEPPVLGAAGGISPMPTPLDAIAAHVLEIQILCDACGADPAEFLSETAAGGCL